MNPCSFLIMLIVTMLLPCATAWCASYPDLVVMVDVGKARGVDYGAGVIISETAQRTVIATALHLVEDGHQPTGPVSVEFRGMRGKTFTGSVNRYYKNPVLDLALVFVERNNGPPLPHYIEDASRTAVSSSAPSTLNGASVQIIGAMGRARWATGVKTDRIISARPDTLVIASDAARAGASGGAVFDSGGRLLGIVSRASQGQLEATSMAAILSQVERWGIAIGLGRAEVGSSAPDSLAELRKSLKFSVTYLPPPRSDPAYPIKEQGRFTHRIAVTMTSALAALDPFVELHYQMYPPTMENLMLLPPRYAVERLEAPATVDGEAWVTFPDGRKLGPLAVTLDFETGPTAAARVAGARGAELLEYGKKALATGRGNARVGEERRKELMALSERLNAQRRLADEARQRQQLIDSFDRISIRCSEKEQVWKCDFPMVPGSNAENLLQVIRLGTSNADLFIEIDPAVFGGIPRAFVDETTRLLTASEHVSDIYVQMVLRTGAVLGPTRLCHVRRFQREGRAYCNND